MNTIHPKTGGRVNLPGLRRVPSSKRCATCNQVKPRSEYDRKEYNKDRLAYSCRTCTAAIAKRRRIAMRKQQRKAHQA